MYIPDSMRPFLFKEGSWWFFENDINGTRDTLSLVKVVSEVKEGNTPMACRGSRLFELYDMSITNGIDTFRLITHGYPYLYLSAQSGEISSAMLDVSIPVGECSKFDSRLCHVGNSQLSIGNNSFNDVLHMTNVLSDGMGSQLATRDLFGVKNTGLIKVVIHDSVTTSLSLVEWHVIQ